ncbi:MAG: hypothetical protein NT169_28375 [Chloroflexi bacterium]|nr:hypothetical protein [Chloroflexota bacterium]
MTYLTVEANRLHRREMLAGLLWPDSPDTAVGSRSEQRMANGKR